MQLRKGSWLAGRADLLGEGELQHPARNHERGRPELDLHVLGRVRVDVQIEVREATTSCSQPGAFTPHANKAQLQHAAPQSGIEPANVACYGIGDLIESNIYGPDGMRAVRHVEKRLADGTKYLKN